MKNDGEKKVPQGFAQISNQLFGVLFSELLFRLIIGRNNSFKNISYLESPLFNFCTEVVIIVLNTPSKWFSKSMVTPLGRVASFLFRDKVVKVPKLR